MARINHFEEIEAWQKARSVTRKIYVLSNQGDFARDYGLRDQIRRSAVSIMSNIAEGFEREGNKEFIQFLSTAKGSAGEFRSQLYVCLDAGFIDQNNFDDLHGLIQEIGGKIGALIRYLKNSELRGSKFTNR